MVLSWAQAAAVEHVATYTRSRKTEALELLSQICRMSDISAEALDEVRTNIRRHARVALHFHPDRPCATGEVVALALLRDGRYRSQYETRISNGGLTAHSGGRRDICEERLFGGVYQSPGVVDSDRPKYGALELLRRAEGPSPRFGSCYLVLSPSVGRRATFTYLDSHEDPIERGTCDEFDDILAALLRDAFLRESALGENGLAVPPLIERLRTQLPRARGSAETTSLVRNLNEYIEAQVHGDIDLSTDAEALVADPSFRGTEVGELLSSISKRYALSLFWHHGFRLLPEEVPRDFRGPTMPSLARRVAGAGYLNAAALGVAVHELRRDAAAWSDRGTADEVLQELKLLWHVLVKCGHPEQP